MTTVVTSATGGRASPAPAVYVPPERQEVAAESAAFAEAGLDSAFLGDLLNACLAHERCGVHLYRSVSGRTGDPALRAQYERFGAETLEHVAKLEELIASSGGDPQYVSPSARSTEKAAAGLLESTFLIDGSLDPLTAELAMLEAVMLAESKDRANWVVLAEVAAALGASAIRSRFEEVTTDVLSQEEEHYTWATDTRTTLLLSLATSVAGAAGTPAVDDGGDEPTRDELYEAAKELDIAGRSRMTKDQLLVAVEGGRGSA
jgi:rubrerythrin